MSSRYGDGSPVRPRAFTQTQTTMPLKGLAGGEGGGLEDRSLSYVDGMGGNDEMRGQVEDIVRK